MTIEKIVQQMEQLEKTTKYPQPSELLFFMNQKYRQLEDEFKRKLRKLDVDYSVIK